MRGLLNGLLLAESDITGDPYNPVDGSSRITSSPPKRRVHEPEGAKWCGSDVMSMSYSLYLDGRIISHLARTAAGAATWLIAGGDVCHSGSVEDAKQAVAEAKADLEEDGYYWEEVPECEPDLMEGNRDLMYGSKPTQPSDPATMCQAVEPGGVRCDNKAVCLVSFRRDGNIISFPCCIRHNDMCTGNTNP